MQRGEGSMPFIRAWLKMAFTVFLFSFLWEHPSAGGSLIEDTVNGLYDGDRISFQATTRPSSKDDPYFIVSLLQGSDAHTITLSSDLSRFNTTDTKFIIDRERGISMRTTESLSLSLSQRPSIFGAEQPSIALSYPQLDFTRFEGKRLNDIARTFTHQDANNSGALSAMGPFQFESDGIRVNSDLEIEHDVFLAATYSLTRSWDVGMYVPILPIVRFGVDAQTTVMHNLGPGMDWLRSREGRDGISIGDIGLFTQYNFSRKQPWWPELAIVGQVTLPTGDRENFLTTGETNIGAFLVASRSFGRLTPHVSFGFDWTAKGAKLNNLAYIMGLEAKVHPSLTLTLNALNNWESNGHSLGNHTVDLALEGTWNALRTFFVNANVQFPMRTNENPLKGIIWTIGIEYVF